MSKAKKQKTVSTSSPVIEDDGRLCAVTVRFPHWVWETIRSIAADRSCSMAELVRQVVQYGLSDIDQHFLRDEQMAEIRSAVVQLMDVISQVERELHRIGINYNQEIRLRHIQQKYENLTDIDSRMNQIRETETVKKESNNLSKEELDHLISRYEDATKKTGEILYQILG